jgi:hypothetical protein
MKHMHSTRARRHAATACAVLALLASAPASAQWAVVDLPHTIKTALGWIAQYQQMIETYQTQLEQAASLDRQFEQALVTGDAYAGTPGRREQFQARPLDHGLEGRCGQTAAGHRTGPQQFAYCQAIVETENRRFNVLVDVMETVATRDEELREALEERQSIAEDEEGKLASNSNRILAIQGQLQNDLQNADAMLGAYDATLSALRDDQSRAGARALGDGTTSVAQGVALRLALRAARSRER